MKYLLDTNIFIWFIEGDNSLSDEYRNLILNEKNDIYVSIASIWEIVIKRSIGKLDFKRDFFIVLNKLLENEEFYLQNITLNCLQFLEKLPFIHKDPFDRIIYSLAKSEDMILLFTDKIFEEYKSLDI